MLLLVHNNARDIFLLEINHYETIKHENGLPHYTELTATEFSLVK